MNFIRWNKKIGYYLYSIFSEVVASILSKLLINFNLPFSLNFIEMLFTKYNNDRIRFLSELFREYLAINVAFLRFKPSNLFEKTSVFFFWCDWKIRGPRPSKSGQGWPLNGLIISRFLGQWKPEMPGQRDRIIHLCNKIIC